MSSLASSAHSMAASTACSTLPENMETEVFYTAQTLQHLLPFLHPEELRNFTISNDGIKEQATDAYLETHCTCLAWQLRARLLAFSGY